MAGRPPDGDPAPADGALPGSALERVSNVDFGIYIHIPFCASRCGYCDFNTYTAAELGPGASRAGYAAQAIAELRLARKALAGAPEVSTVFFGGGTPTLLPAADLIAILGAIRDEFGLAAGAEVSTEANPESADEAKLAELAAGGFTRLSLGMQSAVPGVLATLDRAHTPGRAARCVGWARRAGFGQVSLDLIYGTPGETDAGWMASVDAALAAGPDHVSAYALIVEEGTRLAARIGRGELPEPDDDDLASRYLAADERFTAAGLDWYEVSNWARPGARCRHNLGYWHGSNWWGIGPGAHSHVGGVRWWNARHPAAYAARIAAGQSPAQAREILTAGQRRTEEIMLATRLVTGYPLDRLSPAGREAANRATSDGLADPAAARAGRLTLTRRGRLLADAVIRDLID